MKLFDAVISVVFVAIFFQMFITSFKPVLKNIKEQEKLEERYNCDKFIAESFLRRCGEGNLDGWEEETFALCPVESLKIERIYENNPTYLKAVWKSGGISRECLGKLSLGKIAF